jgi:hypothetical protein
LAVAAISDELLPLMRGCLDLHQMKMVRATVVFDFAVAVLQAVPVLELFQPCFLV